MRKNGRSYMPQVIRCPTLHNAVRQRYADTFTRIDHLGYLTLKCRIVIITRYIETVHDRTIDAIIPQPFTPIIEGRENICTYHYHRCDTEATTEYVLVPAPFRVSELVPQEYQSVRHRRHEYELQPSRHFKHCV